MPKFYFNQFHGTCDLFFYSGCGGNGNQFNSLQDCERACKPSIATEYIKKRSNLMTKGYRKREDQNAIDNANSRNDLGDIDSLGPYY